MRSENIHNIDRLGEKKVIGLNINSDLCHSSTEILSKLLFNCLR